VSGVALSVDAALVAYFKALSTFDFANTLNAARRTAGVHRAAVAALATILYVKLGVDAAIATCREFFKAANCAATL
jgi:hypothetical protein